MSHRTHWGPNAWFATTLTIGHCHNPKFDVTAFLDVRTDNYYWSSREYQLSPVKWVEPVEPRALGAQ